MRQSLRLLFVLVLLFSQTGGLIHGIAHTLAVQDESLPHETLCDLCASYAQLGSALGNHTVTFSHVAQRQVFVTTSFKPYFSTNAYTAFSARAPPYSA